MNLRQYVETERGNAANLARALGVSPVMVSQWVSGVKSVPAERCPAIERATGGDVRCEELRPDVEWNVLRDPRPDVGGPSRLSIEGWAMSKPAVVPIGSQ